MKHSKTLQRLLSLLLTVTLLAGLAVPVGATEEASVIELEMEQVDNSYVTGELPLNRMESKTEDTRPADEVVRVSIVLDTPSVMDAGYDLKEIASNEMAMNHRAALAEDQAALRSAIETYALNGEKLDVVWNLTLAANIISANVPLGAVEKIAALDGVRTVVEETRYEPQVASAGGDYEPQMGVSGQMTGSQQAWQNGYTGAGTRIAVIDTGLDTDHQSFSSDAFDHAIAQASEANGVSYEEQLLDAEGIAKVLEHLNVYQRVTAAGETLTAEELYINSKAAFGYNYIDASFDVTHDNDTMGEHGSHVSGIAAANRYLEKDGAYVDALREVNVAGNAPDAQLLVMKVFGAEGGAYDSDIMAAVEDALILGADTVNLSLGSSVAGRTYCEEEIYQELFDSLVESDTVVAISAGNYGYWAEMTYNGYLYNDGINYATGGSPGTYTNSLAVASVDNDGTIGSTLKVNDSTIGVTESTTNSVGAAFGNAAISTLDTSEDGSGTAYPFVLVESIGNTEDYTGMDLTGKIVFVARGELDFSTKANNAAALGAAAVVVYNVTAGSGVNMDLSTYTHTAPVVSITLPDSLTVKAAAEAQTTEDGVSYYTGTVTVVGKPAAVYNDSEYKTISSFSSWGVPSDLTLKPEITAPGGNIYSVNGLDTSGTAYELMSGTSMAAPQIAGMSALLLQYLEENSLTAEGLTARGLAQSLLMSTAEPMLNAANDNYYSVMQQGAGLANVDSAMNTPVYITVDGMADGKVKVELGDDADRTGVYTFSFRLNNLSDEAVSYDLSADVFTQDVFEDESGNGYLDTLTRTMDAVTTFEGGSTVEVPANGSVAVAVTIALTEDEKARLAEDYPVGAYVQAYVRALPAVTAEGETLPELSIPVFGFYGGWYEASMYDIGSYVEYLAGEETRMPYFASAYVNAFGVTYGDDTSVTYYFGGNPVEADETYMPDRNALNLARGDYFAGIDFALIRNAGAHRASVVNTTTGEELFYEEGGAVDAAYFMQALASWMGVPKTFELDFAPDMEEGERGLVSLTTVVELYAQDGEVDWDKGSTLEMPFTVDNTAPELYSVEVDTETNVLRVTASDNQYVAGVAIYDVTGRNLLATCGSDPDALPEETVTLEVPLDEVDGYKFVIQVIDYAVNKTTYKLTQTIGDPDPLPEMLYYHTTFGEWQIGDWPATSSELVSYNGWFSSSVDPVAATAVGSYVFMVDDSQNLYAAPGDNMLELAFIRTLEYQLVDMTYDAVNGIIYGLTDAGVLVSLDRMTGALTEIGAIYLGSSYYQAASLAYDGNGTFYTTKSGSYPQLYSFTLDTYSNATYIGYLDPYSYGNQCLEYNKKDGMLYYICKYSGFELWKIDPNDLSNEEYRYFYGDVTTLIFPDWSEEANAWYDPNGKISGITLNKSNSEVFVGKTLQLSANISPWNVSDRSVIYSSADPSVATVNADGLVTGVSVGTTTITAASAADPTITAECTINVSVLDITVEGTLIDANNVSQLYTWDAAGGEDWVGGLELPRDAIAVSLVPDENAFYMIDENNVTYKLDMTTGEDLSGPHNYLPNSYYYPHGLAYSSVFSTEETEMVYYIRNGQLSRPRDPASSAYWSTFSIGSDHSYLAAVTAAGTEPYNYYGADYDSEILYMVDDTGAVFRANIFVYYNSYMIRYTRTPSTLPANVFAGKEFSSLVMGDDGALYLSAYNNDSNSLYRLTLNEDEGVYDAMELNGYGENVWPATLLKVTTNEQQPAGKFDLYGASMALESDLTMNFFVDEDHISGEDWYAEIVRNGETVTIPMSQWMTNNGYYQIAYSGIAAKEMTDELTVTIYNAAGEAVSNAWTDSVRAYAMRMLGDDAKLNTVLVDMLNYGAEAQTYFGYKTEDLANSQLTDEQKAYATETVAMTDGRTAGSNYFGTSLSLEFKIELNLYFKNVTEDMTATVTYTDHYGNEVNETKTLVKNASYMQVLIDDLAVADARTLVTCVITDAEGGVVASVTDSVESYCARMTSLALREPLMKFAGSAYNYFHN